MPISPLLAGQLRKDPSELNLQTLIPPSTTVDAANHTFLIMPHKKAVGESKSTATCNVEAILGTDADSVTLKMVYHNGATTQEITFPFDLTNDTATDVVSELVEASLIEAVDEQLVRRRIEEAVRSILIRQRSRDGRMGSSDERTDSPTPKAEQVIEQSPVSFASFTTPLQVGLATSGPIPNEGVVGALNGSKKVNDTDSVQNSQISSDMAGAQDAQNLSDMAGVQNQRSTSGTSESLNKNDMVVAQHKASDLSGSPSSTLPQSARVEQKAPKMNPMDVDARLRELQEFNLRNFDTLTSKPPTPEDQQSQKRLTPLSSSTSPLMEPKPFNEDSHSFLPKHPQ